MKLRFAAWISAAFLMAGSIVSAQPATGEGAGPTPAPTGLASPPADSPFTDDPGSGPAPAPAGQAAPAPISPFTEDAGAGPTQAPATAAPAQPTLSIPTPPAEAPAAIAKSGSSADFLTSESLNTAARRAAAVPTDEAEIRGLEVLSSVPGFQTEEQVRDLTAQVMAAGFNRVYPEIRTAYGEALSSNTEAMLPFISSAFANPTAALKGTLAGTAKVIPIVGVLPAYSAITGVRPLPGNILAKFPAFRNQSVNGDFVAIDNQIYLDPGSTAVQDYLAAIFLEIDTKVLPDGYLLSGVAYPGKEWGYSERAVSEFRTIVGGVGAPPPDDPTWGAYRRDQLTKLLKRLTSAVKKDRPGVKFGVVISVSGPPPQTWDEWIKSPTYAERMQDWLTWCHDGVIDEIVLEVHERLSTQGNVLEDWTNFLTSNCAPARPVISLSGGQNFNEGLTTQYQLVRSRGVGTILHHYAAPSRSGSRGFFASLPDTIFNVPPGRGLPPKPLLGSSEFRQFSQMINPPPAIGDASQANGAADTHPFVKDSDLVLEIPSPTPAMTPVQKLIPTADTRRITLISGMVVDAVVLEVTPVRLTLKSIGGAPMEIPRSRIAKIEPPL